MKKGKMITLIGTVVIFLIMIVYVTYSTVTDINDMKVSTYTGTRPVFTSTGNASLVLNIQASDMDSANVGDIVSENNLTLNVAASASSEETTCCDFDFTLYNNTSIKNTNGLKFSIYKDSTLLKTTSVNIDPSNATSTIYSGSVCTSSTLGYKSASYKINAAFYNLNENQDNMYGLTNQDLSIKVTNVSCKIDNSMSTAIKLKASSASSVSAGSSGLIDEGIYGTRYIGPSPDNYIYFNCDDYDNQSASTCETWRIIGVFDENMHGQSGKNLVKIVRGESLGTIDFDTANYNGSNNFELSQMAMILNPEEYISSKATYDSSTGYIYYPSGTIFYRESGAYYYRTIGYSLAINDSTLYKFDTIKTRDFSTTGLKESTRNLISEASLNIPDVAGSDTITDYYVWPTAKDSYEQLYLSGIVNNNGAYTGKVFLPDLSDVSLSTSGSSTATRESCITLPLGEEYSGSMTVIDRSCLTGSYLNLMLPGESGKYGWTMTSNGLYYFLFDTSALYQVWNLNGYEVYPTVFLNENIAIKSGTGTSSDPYQLKVD